MGDWTSGAATIHSCPPHRAQEVLDALIECGLIDEDSTDGATLKLGESYIVEEFRCGSATDLTHELIKDAPEAAFTVYEEPAYEWIGTTYTYVPELGLFTAGCDSSGEPLFTQSQILRLDGKPADIWKKVLGVPWLTAIADMPTMTVADDPDQLSLVEVHRSPTP